MKRNSLVAQWLGHRFLTAKCQDFSFAHSQETKFHKPCRVGQGKKKVKVKMQSLLVCEPFTKQGFLSSVRIGKSVNTLKETVDNRADVVVC